jgi:hypothetical protein
MKSPTMFRLAPVAALACLTTGCMTHTTLDVRLDPGRNLTAAPAVAITTVTDKRVFERRPRRASIPSLANKQIQNTAFTAKAIGRRRNTDGMALGNVFLPEGRTVADVTREAVTAALQAKGYAVVPAGRAGAVPLEVEVQQFWVWLDPGFAIVAMEFETVLTLRSEGLFKDKPETVRGSVRLHTGSIANRAWMNTVRKGLNDLGRDLESKLPPPRP